MFHSNFFVAGTDICFYIQYNTLQFYILLQYQHFVRSKLIYRFVITIVGTQYSVGQNGGSSHTILRKD